MASPPQQQQQAKSRRRVARRRRRTMKKRAELNLRRRVGNVIAAHLAGASPNFVSPRVVARLRTLGRRPHSVIGNETPAERNIRERKERARIVAQRYRNIMTKGRNELTHANRLFLSYFNAAKLRGNAYSKAINLPRSTTLRRIPRSVQSRDPYAILNYVMRAPHMKTVNVLPPVAPNTQPRYRVTPLIPSILNRNTKGRSVHNSAAKTRWKFATKKILGQLR